MKISIFKNFLFFVVLLFLVSSFSICDAQTKTQHKAFKTPEETVMLNIAGKELDLFKKTPEDYIKKYLIEKGYTVNKIKIETKKAATPPATKLTVRCKCCGWCKVGNNWICCEWCCTVY